MKKILLLFIFMISLVMPAMAQPEPVPLKSEVGKVEKIEYQDMEPLPASENDQVKQYVTVELLTGEFKGKSLMIDNVITGNPYYDIMLKKGDRVILHSELTGNEVDYYIADIQRVNFLYVLVGIFVFLLLLIGQKKGFLSLVSIIVTILLIFFILMPMVLNRFSPLLATLIVCLLSSVITLYLVGGFNNKSTAAVIETILSLVFASCLSYLTLIFSRLTGFSSEETMFLYTAYPNLNYGEIVISSMLLAALGAVMDTAMSIASSVNEFYEINNSLSVKELVKSGMNVGKDVIGTMANTLILVYLGSSLPLVLLSSNIDIQKFFNLNQVVTEISSALIGSVSLIICVPITAVVISNLVKFNNDDIIIENKKNRG